MYLIKCKSRFDIYLQIFMYRLLLLYYFSTFSVDYRIIRIIVLLFDRQQNEWMEVLE